MNETTPPQKRSSISTFLAGALGGLIVLVLGAALIATDVIDTGDETTRVVRESVPVRDVADSTASPGGRTVADIYKREGAGVVFVLAEGASESTSPFGPPGGGGQASGSGFVVDKDGTIITNAHVVGGADEVQVRFEEDGDAVDAEVVASDPDTDVAILKVDPDDADLQPLPLGDSSETQVGDPVVAIGNPFGYTRSVTTGIVSAKQRQIEAPSGFSIANVIQTDASINPGNSGGPLLDADGKVIGINSQIATGGSQGSVGIGFAVPIDTVKELLPRLKRGDEIERAFLGIEMIGVTEEIARDLNLAADEGALIQDVVEGGPADEAGLRDGGTQLGEQLSAGGDLIVEVDGDEIRTSDDVPAAIEDRKPGDEVEIVFYRGDERKTATVELGKRPSSLNATEQQPDDGGGIPDLP
ncbi:MAG TPA: trypsin-like peptidase domain-containing protein [Thermoleophilaceae bacterium]|nr:trypsin-like peptidase domain-containing protein [Thermoleophilaceae bacterium]